MTIMASAPVPAHSRIFDADTIDLGTVRQTTTIPEPVEVAEIVRRISDYLNDPTAPQESQATIRSALRRMISLAENIAFLAANRQSLRAATSVNTSLTDDERAAILTRLDEHPIEGPDVEFVVLTRAELADRQWLAYSRGVKDRADVGLDEPWPSAPPVDPAFADCLSEMRARWAVEGGDAS